MSADTCAGHSLHYFPGLVEMEVLIISALISSSGTCSIVERISLDDRSNLRWTSTWEEPCELFILILYLTLLPVFVDSEIAEI